MKHLLPVPPAVSAAMDDFNILDVLDNWQFYISGKMHEFEKYDAKRPAGHDYPFDVHAVRVAYLMEWFARYLGWDEDMATMLYWATLPHDIGKMALPVTIWDSTDKPTDDEKKLRRTHVAEGLNMLKNELSDEILERPFTILLLDIMENHHEALDGSGLFGKTGENLSLIAKMSAICDSFDGYSVKRAHFGDRDISIAAVLTRMGVEKKGQYDAQLLELFSEMLKTYFQTGKNFVENYNELDKQGLLPYAEIFDT